jgi:hypothetical protein
MYDKLLCLMISKLLFTKCKCIATVLLLILSIITSSAQDSTLNKLLSVKKLESIESKATSYNSKIDKQTEKYLKKIERQEKKLEKKIARLDSSAAKQLFDDLTLQYDGLKKKLTDKTTRFKNSKVVQRFGGLDSTNNYLQFIKDNELFKNVKNVSEKVNSTLDQYKELKEKLALTKDISAFMQQRKELLKQTLDKFKLGKHLKKYNKAVYYYSEQIKSYKEIFRRPEKIEQKILEHLRKLPAFNDFVARNNLTQLFPNANLNNISSVTANLGSATSYSGLQSRTSVQQAIIQNVFNNTPNSAVDIQSQFNQSMNTYNQFKVDFENQKSGGAIKKNQGFRPNSQKTKSFKERISFSYDIQFQRKSNVLPNASNVAVNLNYKANDFMNSGIGMAFKIGFGESIQKIKFTTESIGLRSFIEYKTIHSLYVRVGAEYSYNIARVLIPNVLERENWDKSALLGLSKKVNFKSKSASVQLMYDFLYKQNIPFSNPLIYRISYNF